MNIHGYTLLEVLVALVLISIALLGLAGLQIRAQQAEIEAYQRAQAMLLVEDMVNRISLNRQPNIVKFCYGISNAQTGEPFLGTGNTTDPSCIGGGTGTLMDLADADMAAWDNLLKGASETLGGNNVGGLVGARGCIYFIDNPGTPEAVTVTVAWQGESETGTPDDECATGLYGSESLRRTVSETIRFADLSS